jgi:hypothetical protein
MKRISLITIAMFFTGALPAQQGMDEPPGHAASDIFRTLGVQSTEPIKPGSLRLRDSEINLLLQSRPGDVFTLPSLNGMTASEQEPLQFERTELYTAVARIHIVGQSTQTLPPPRERMFFIARNSSTRVGLAIDGRNGTLKGLAIKAGAQLGIHGNVIEELYFVEDAPPEDGQASCALELDRQPAEATEFLAGGSFSSRSDAPAGAALEWEAEVAVDTDTEWLSGFGNDTSAANAWIEDLFLSMNVMFERDVATRLLISEVILRTGSDPYVVNSSDHSNHLNEFAQHWRLNQGAIHRDFAAMLSGRNIGSGSFSGIAWLNQYCQKGFVPFGQTYTVGSYSFNAIGSSWSASSVAKFVGHELGHNMGSPHTHCLSNGQGGFIDQCFNGEGGCYSGATSCPGPGSGTTMSYCHLLGGCGSTPNFHPLVQSLLEDRLASNSPSCISPPAPAGPNIYADGFE